MSVLGLQKDFIYGTVIITMGSRGSVLVKRSDPTPCTIPADTVDRVVDTTGAGNRAIIFVVYHFISHLIV